MNIFNKPHLMVDLETLSTHQNATIVSIGAVKFTFEDGLGEEFLINISPKTCIERGLHVEKATLKWWLTQPKEIINLWKFNPQPLDEALVKFNDFVGTTKNQFIWAHGAIFDLGVIRSAFEACGVERNWKYWVEMDDRTIFNLLGIRNDKIRAQESGHHSALDDAKSQARTLINAFKT